MNISITGIIFIMLFITNNAFAFEPSEIQVNKNYYTNGTINFRDSPPKTIFYILGDLKGSPIAKNKKITVKKVKPVGTLFGKYYWLNIEFKNSKTDKTENGWIYAGEDDHKALLREKLK